MRKQRLGNVKGFLPINSHSPTRELNQLVVKPQPLSRSPGAEYNALSSAPTLPLLFAFFSAL